MNFAKSVYILVLLAFWLSFAVSITIADAETVHALLIIMDDDPTIGNNVEIDRKRVKQLLGFVNEICEVKTTTLLSSKDTATRDGVLRWAQNMSVVPDDIVFIYYAGHGGMNRDGKTFLATEGQWIFRSELVDALEQVKAARLTILITDCCSSLVQSNLEPTLQSSRSMTRLTQRVLQNLFLEHKGFLHVTAATEGQYGWSNAVTGGWFTRNFINALDSNPDENRDSFLSWEEVFVKARESTEKTFSQTTFTGQQRADMKRKGITSQTPKAYSLPKPLSGSALQTEALKDLNLIFGALVLVTLGISHRIARRLKKQYVSRARLNSHRSKAFAIVVVEVLIWIGFNVFGEFFRANWVLVCITGVVIIGIILSQKKKQYA